MIEYLFMVAVIIAMLRAIAGPTFADRIISVNTMVSLIVVIMVIYAIATNSEMLLDVGIVLMMLSFVGTLAIAKFSRGKDND